MNISAICNTIKNSIDHLTWRLKLQETGENVWEYPLSDIPSIQLDSWTQYRCSMWAMVWVRTTQEGVVGRDSTRSSTRVESTTVLRSVPPWMEHGRGSLDTNAHDPRFHPAIQISIPRRNRHPAPNDYLMFDNFWMDLCIFKKGFEWIFAFKKRFWMDLYIFEKGFWMDQYICRLLMIRN